jgi:hypothetical protein
MAGPAEGAVRVRLATAVAAALLSFASFAQAQADDAPPMPELVDAYIGIERQAGAGSTLDGEPLYFIGAVKLEGERITLYRELRVCRDATLQTPTYAGQYWYAGRIDTQVTPWKAMLRMTGCDHCGRAETAEPEPAALDLDLSPPREGELQLGETRYSRRMRFDRTDCPDEATDAARSDTAPSDSARPDAHAAVSSPRTE